MSVNIYHEGEHPAGYLGVRITVGSDTRSDTKVEYLSFRANGKALSMSARKKIISKAKRREKELKEKLGGDRRCFGSKTVNNYKAKRIKDLETNIRGLYILFSTKKAKLANGDAVYYPTCFIISETNGYRKTFSTRHFEKFNQKWEDAIKCHADNLGLKKIKSNWAAPPITKSVFDKHIRRVKKASPHI